MTTPVTRALPAVSGARPPPRSGMTPGPRCATSCGQRCRGEGAERSPPNGIPVEPGHQNRWTQTPRAASLPPRSCAWPAATVRRCGIVYQDTSAKLFGVCLRILKDRSEAEDVLQDVYVTVWRKAATFDPGRASPITWMVAIARNRAIDRLRASARQPPHASRSRPPTRSAIPPRSRSSASSWRSSSSVSPAAWRNWKRGTRPPSARRSSTAPPTRNWPRA